MSVRAISDNIKTFVHACDELQDHPVCHYAVVYDNIVRRSECFALAKIDEQALLLSSQDEPLEYLDDYFIETLEGRDSPYAECVVYFIPQQFIDTAKQCLNKKIHQWMHGKNSGLVYSYEGDIYIALRYTADGMWILTYDNTKPQSIFYDKAHNIFEDVLPFNDDYRDLNTCHIGYNMQNSAGYDFFSFFKRENPALFNLMITQQLFDKDCYES